MRRRARADGLDDFTRAIMTTDRFEKRALQLPAARAQDPRARGRRGQGRRHDRAQHGHHARLRRHRRGGDAEASCARRCARRCEATFNQISVDGDTSTNDSLFVLASGAAKNKPIDGGDKGHAFRAALREVLDDLSRQIVRDGEGATHVVTIEVLGAPTAPRRPSGWRDASAARRWSRRRSSAPIPTGGASSARWATPASSSTPTRSTSPSVRSRSCAAAWASAARRSGRRTRSCGAASTSLRVHLHDGRGEGRHTTCDLGVDYVKLNADYRS